MSQEMRNDHDAGQVYAQDSATPDWVGAPQGWNRLEAIERWLRLNSGAPNSYWIVQAELSLGEGRLEFARADADGSTDEAALLARLGAAQSNFRRVLANPSATSAEEYRAQRGLEEIAVLQRDSVHSARNTNSGSLAGRPIPRASWRATAPQPGNLTRTSGDYDRITIHHTAQVPGTRFDGSLSDSINVMQKVQTTHMAQRGYGDIGYHFLIDAEGRVFEGRDLRYQGAHAGSQKNVNNNVRNIGVCLIGDFQFTQPSARAMGSLESLLIDLRSKYGIDRSRIKGHGELKATECPGPMLARWTTSYRSSGPRLASDTTYRPSPSATWAQAAPRSSSTRGGVR